MRSITYPNQLADLVVVGFRGPMRFSFTIRPLTAGTYRLLLWPDGFPDPDLFLHLALDFRSENGPPARVTVDLHRTHHLPVDTWRWALVRTSEFSSPIGDLASAAFGGAAIAQSKFPVAQISLADVRCVAWSCHMPYESAGEHRAGMDTESESILDWYATEVRTFRPHVIWGGGDTAYSDGTDATDFSNQVYNRGAWYRSLETKTWLRNEYRRMYRHFWSLPGMRTVMGEVPHLFMWDDHEIHDGWGSEGMDFEDGNFEMFRVARDVAEEYILNVGPRLRPSGVEAHQAYVLGPMAAFVFDTRSTRHYDASHERIISRAQFEDFVRFLEVVRAQSTVTHLVTNTSVPLVGLLDWVTTLMTRAPDLLNDVLLQGVRDDVRDSWTSPGNIETLAELLSAIRSFMTARPDVRVVNVSGDIHVSNAFEIHIPGASRPIYQLTTSAITNRHHAPGLIAFVTEIPDAAMIEGVGWVRRIWDTVTAPNILMIRLENQRAVFTLKVWDAQNTGSKNLRLEL